MEYLLIEMQQTPGWREICFCGEEIKIYITIQQTFNSCAQCVPDIMGKSYEKDEDVIGGGELAFLVTEEQNTIQLACIKQSCP